MRILVTGATGFAGGHLIDLLLKRGGSEIVGIARHAPWPVPLQHLADRVTLVACDASDRAALENLLHERRPEQIYHLAGYAHAGQSFREQDAAWAGNLGASRALYDAVIRWGGKPRILFVGSGLIYGDPERPDQSYDESSPLRPNSPYAASKAAADLASYQYTRSPGLDIVRARPFNHVGPRQSPQYAVAHFAEQIAAAERGRRPPLLETGNLMALRDLTDVRDVAEAYTLLMERGRTGEAYNVATGTAHSMQTIVDRLVGLGRVSVEMRQRPDLLRARDTSAVRGDSSKLRSETGWQPRIALETTLQDTLDYWRQQA
jgi:GDP-4-dehydro-6-deoxy-D-mannose reductase